MNYAMKRHLKTGKKVLEVLLMIAVLMSVGGCFDRRELNALAIVVGVAVDQAETEGETELTLQMAKVSEQKSSKAEKSEGSSYINASNSGKNINEIIRNLQHKMSRRVYMPHNQVIIFSEDFAKEGVRDSLDFFARAPEARMTLYVLVTKGRAADILEVEPQFEKIPATELAQLISEQKITSQAPIVTEFEFVSAMTSKTTSPVAPIVEIIEVSGSKMLSCMGCAVFKDTKMIGELDYKETRGMLHVKGEVEAGIMLVDVLGASASIEIRKANTKVTPELKEDGTIIFKVDVEEMVGIGDQSGTVNLAAPENAPSLLAAVKRATEEEIQSAVDISKKLNADIFGFGECISRKYPDKWKDMKDKWDELYQDIEVEINVEVEGNGSGRSVKPLIPEEE